MFRTQGDVKQKVVRINAINLYYISIGRLTTFYRLTIRKEQNVSRVYSKINLVNAIEKEWLIEPIVWNVTCFSANGQIHQLFWARVRITYDLQYQQQKEWKYEFI